MPRDVPRDEEIVPRDEGIVPRDKKLCQGTKYCTKGKEIVPKTPDTPSEHNAINIVPWHNFWYQGKYCEICAKGQGQFCPEGSAFVPIGY